MTGANPVLYPYVKRFTRCRNDSQVLPHWLLFLLLCLPHPPPSRTTFQQQKCATWCTYCALIYLAESINQSRSRGLAINVWFIAQTSWSGLTSHERSCIRPCMGPEKETRKSEGGGGRNGVIYSSHEGTCMRKQLMVHVEQSKKQTRKTNKRQDIAGGEVFLWGGRVKKPISVFQHLESLLRTITIW
jgi:hypothetical protein